MSTQPQLDFMRPLGTKAASPTVVEKGKALKRAGMSRAAEKHRDSLHSARGWAKHLANNGLSITIEQVRTMVEIYGVWDLGNAAGSVFKGPEWECVGYREAQRPEAHCRILRVWRLRR